MKISKEVEKALDFAIKAHGGQMYGSHPYSHHLKNTVDLANSLGYDIDVQVACALHDVLEDTDVSFLQLESVFGHDIANIVFCVTDEKGNTRWQRKLSTYPKIFQSKKAITVKLIDRISNINSCLTDYIANEKKIKMYISEHSSFVNGINNDIHYLFCRKAWRVYYNAINNLKFCYSINN